MHISIIVIDFLVEKAEDRSGEEHGTSKCGHNEVLSEKLSRNDGRLKDDSDLDHSGRITSDDDLSEEHFDILV